MALSDLAVFQEYVQTAMSETQDQQVDKFNGATRGGIILTSAAHQGDFSSTAIWAKISGLVRRRNSYGSGAVAQKTLSQLVSTSVKVASGTPPIEINPGMFKWIQKSPEEAGVVIGKQLAEDNMADMLNVGIMGYRAAVGNVPQCFSDKSAAVCDLSALMSGAAKFGDRSQDIVAWLMHSKSSFDVYGQALANSERLFTFGNIQVMEDGFGRPLVVTDSPSLVVTDGVSAGVDSYYQLGLAGGGIIVEQGNEFTDNIQTTNGEENILRTYQAEWTYQLGMKGFTWDTTTGGKSPNNAALASAANWDRLSTSHKDLAGVLVETR
jgi:hypothetical protein